MDQDRWKEVSRIFHEALAMPVSERHPYVVSSSHGDRDLQQEVEQLLKADQDAGSYLEKPLFDEGSLSSESAPLHAGDVLCKRFRLVREIAVGGMGQVYEAFDSELGVQVALKVIRPEISSDPRALARFRQEVKLARRITHLNVCRTFDIERDSVVGSDGETHDVVFLTMEFLNGETMAARIRREGPLPPGLAKTFACQIASAIDAAHALGIIHRDLKPGNVMLVPSGDSTSKEQLRAVITDFGLARFASIGSDSVTQSNSGMGGWFAGTMAYMSPEQLEGRAATAASDIYALGLVIYEMTTGERPFHGDTPMSAAMKRLAQAPTPPRQFAPALNPLWEAAILRCLERDPAKRFAGPQDVAKALAGDIRSPNGPSLHVDQPLLEEAHTKSRRRRVWVSLGATLALVVAAVVWLLFRPLPPPRATNFTQITNDGYPKAGFVTDGSRIYYTAQVATIEKFFQVSTQGGEPVPMPQLDGMAPVDISADHSELLLLKANDLSVWEASVLGSAPRRIGDLVAFDAI